MTNPGGFYTSNGVPVKPGLRVFGYDYEWGTVEKEDGLESNGIMWWRVQLDSGRSTSYDGSRMTTRAPRNVNTGDTPTDPFPLHTKCGVIIEWARDDARNFAIHCRECAG